MNSDRHFHGSQIPTKNTALLTRMPRSTEQRVFEEQRFTDNVSAKVLCGHVLFGSK